MKPGELAHWAPPALLAAEPDRPRLLEAVLWAVDEQRALLEADIDLLWDDLFIESCADWAVPYLGALLGLPPDAERAEVAGAAELRRRKGTPAALADYALAVTGLTARVVEGWRVTAVAHRPGEPPRPVAADLRGLAAHRIGTPFETARRSVRPAGPWAPDAVNVIVWPWQVRTLIDTEAAPLAEPRRYALHPLGVPAPLQVRPAAAAADETGAPVRATYRVLQVLARPGQIAYAATLTIAPGHPLATTASGEPPLLRLTVGDDPVPWQDLRFGSLPPGAPAAAPPTGGQVVVDVNRGFIELGPDLSGIPRATWHRAVPGRLGALAATGDADPAARVVVEVNPRGGAGTAADLATAFQLAEERSAGLPPGDSRPGRPDVEIRLLTADRLPAPPPQVFTPTLPRWRVVAPPLTTPVIVGDLFLDLAGAQIGLEGFFLQGDLIAGPRLAGLELTGLTMDPGAGGLLIDPAAWELAVTVRRCMLGGIRAELSALAIELADCVVDGRRRRFTACGPAEDGSPAEAVAAQVAFRPVLRADSVTFAGAVLADAVDAVDCLFADGVDVVRQQDGCLRHCHLGPPLSDPPRHPATYRCGPFPAPAFVSDAFDSAGYFCLEPEPEHALLSGASDGGEIGAQHRTRRAARIGRLRRRVEEFVPLGLSCEVRVADWEER